MAREDTLPMYNAMASNSNSISCDACILMINDVVDSLLWFCQISMSKLSLGISLAALTDLRILYKLVCWLRGKYQIWWHNMNQYDTCFLKLKQTNTSDHGRWTHLKTHVTYVVFVFKLCDLEPSFHAKGMSHLSKMYLHKPPGSALFFHYARATADTCFQLQTARWRWKQLHWGQDDRTRNIELCFAERLHLRNASGFVNQIDRHPVWLGFWWKFQCFWFPNFFKLITIA